MTRVNPTPGTDSVTGYAYYPPATGTVCTATQARTVVTDPRAGTTTYCSDPANDRVATARDQDGNDTATTYDPFGNVLTGTSPGSALTTFTYNSRNLPKTSDDPVHSKTAATYANTGSKQDLPDTFTNEAGTSFGFTYDGVGNLLKTSTAASPSGSHRRNDEPQLERHDQQRHRRKRQHDDLRLRRQREPDVR